MGVKASFGIGAMLSRSFVKNQTFWKVLFWFYMDTFQPQRKKPLQAGINSAAGMPDNILGHLNAFPKDAPPMATLSSLISVLAAHNTEDLGVAVDGESFTRPLYTIMAQVLELAAGQYRVNLGKTPNTYNPDLSYAANFMHLMFSESDSPTKCCCG